MISFVSSSAVRFSLAVGLLESEKYLGAVLEVCELPSTRYLVLTSRSVRTRSMNPGTFELGSCAGASVSLVVSKTRN